MIQPVNRAEQRLQGRVKLDSTAAHTAAHRRVHKVLSSLVSNPHGMLEAVCNEFATLIVEYNKLHDVVTTAATELQGTITAMHHVQREEITLQRHRGRLSQCQRRLGRDFIKSFTNHTKYDQLMFSCEDLLNSYLKEMVEREGDGITYTGRLVLNADFSQYKFDVTNLGTVYFFFLSFSTSLSSRFLQVQN